MSTRTVVSRDGAKIVSSDGPQISCEQSGDGSPLVLVHGTGVDRWSFRFVEPLLADRFTVYTVDRRGRGRSGDSTSGYRIEQEFADIAAVVDSLGQPADLLGHSYGATVALGAAPLTQNLRRLILYEPAPGVSSASDAPILASLDALLAQGEREEALSAYLVEFAGFGSGELEELRSSPLWAPRVAAAHTIPREIRAEETYKPDPDTFAALPIPVMLLLGSESPEWAQRGTTLVHSLLQNSRVVGLEGQGHVAIMTAPELLAGEVIRFLAAPRGRDQGGKP